MFFVGIAPALLVFLIRLHVRKARRSCARRQGRASIRSETGRNWKIALYIVVLMTAFNFFSHGTQDQYPTFLQKQHRFDTHLTGTLTAIMNIGAIVGGISFGIWSETDWAERGNRHRLRCWPCRSFRSGHSASTPVLLGLAPS